MNCFGVIPLQRREGEWVLFLIHRNEGFWELPKGHPEEGETPEETATRELFEETGLRIDQWLQLPSHRIEYLAEGKKKQVDYFAATVLGEVKLLPSEVQGGEWLTLSEATLRATYPSTKELLKSLESQIREEV